MLEGRRGAAIGLALFLGLGAFAVWSEISSQKPPIQQRAYVYEPDHGPQNRPASVTSPQTAEDRIADYTWWLGAFTLLLAVVSSVQIFFLIRADKTARTSADAAKTAAKAAQASAEALPNIERAYLFMRLSDYVCTATTQYFDGTTGNPNPVHAGNFYARYFFGNHGKTPAVLHEIRVGTKLSTEPLDPTEWAGCPNILVVERVVAGSDGETPVFDIREPASGYVSLEDGDVIAAGGLFIYFYGCATYSDVFGETHETQFCFRYDRTGLSQWGGREHNRRT
jgi:hypothetical protein